MMFIASCKPETYTPKPRGYYQIDLPAKHEYQVFDSAGFPYRFEYPVYSKIIYNPAFFGEQPENPYWINLDFPGIGGKIYISYKEIEGRKGFMNLNDDMYEMSFMAHNKKANYIKDYYLDDPERDVHIMLYNVTGDAASAYQFYATDSIEHFVRGALYFEATPNSDSLRPLNEFLRKDIDHLLQTIEWK